VKVAYKDVERLGIDLVHSETSVEIRQRSKGGPNLNWSVLEPTSQAQGTYPGDGLSSALANHRRAVNTVADVVLSSSSDFAHLLA
jgi:hypothetical protein